MTAPDTTAGRAHALARDAADPLAAHRERFALPDGVVYLDGNSLGALPRAAVERVRHVVAHEWGTALIRSWNDAGWIDLAQRVAAKIARIIGAAPNEVLCADSTSVNLYKVLTAALQLQASRADGSGGRRRVILSERGNFPTDLYVGQGVAHACGATLRLVDTADIADALDEQVAVLLLTQVDYRSGRMHDLPTMTRRAHAVGALTLWDLAHSAGAVPVDLAAAGADFAVGCGYKYLNGGPGAPAFLFVAQRHLDALAPLAHAQPITGWFGHREPFAFGTDYRPAAGIDRFAVGTPSIVALSLLECGVDTVLAAGIDALRAKSVALTDAFIAHVERLCPELALASPRDAVVRGSQVSFRHPAACAVMQALIARGVIGDVRVPDILRFGFAPLYVRHVDAYDAAHALAAVLRDDEWRDARFQRGGVVT